MVQKELKISGIDGIEVYHSSHSNYQISNFYNLAKKYKLIITGGSDFHYIENGTISIGSKGINEELYNKIIIYTIEKIRLLLNLIFSYIF